MLRKIKRREIDGEILTNIQESSERIKMVRVPPFFDEEILCEEEGQAIFLCDPSKIRK
jgi:hypothetical protein